MRKLLLLLFFGFPTFCSSQSFDSTIVKQVDSLIIASSKLWRMGKATEAEPIALQAKELALNKLGNENATYAASLHNLSGLYVQMGKLKTSAEWGEQALRCREKVLGKTHPDYAKTLNNLGLTYCNMGEYAKAEPLLLEALALREISSGKKSMEYSKVLYNLTRMYSESGKPDEAIYYAKECLEIRKGLDKSSMDYVNAQNVLANAYQTAKRYEEAENLYMDILAKGNATQSNDIILGTGVLSNLAVVYNETGKYEEAEQMNIKSLKLGQETEDNRLKITTLNHLGTVCMNMGRLDEAVVYYKKSLDLLSTKEAGNSSPEYARSLMSLGGVYANLKKYDEAEKCLLEALTLHEKLYGEVSHLNFGVLNNMGELLSQIKQYDEAESFFNKAIAAVGTWNEDVYLTSTVAVNLGLLYTRTGRYTEAEQQFLKNLNACKQYLSKENPKMEDALSRLQWFYLRNSNFQKAIPYALQADTLRKAMFQRNAGYLTDREMASVLDFNATKDEILLSIAFSTEDARLKEAAYDNALFYKGFSLESNYLLQRVGKQQAIGQSETYLKWKAIQRRLAAEYAKPLAEQQQAGTLKDEANELEKQLTRSVASFGYAHEMVNWRQVQAALKPNEAAVEFYHFNFHSPAQADSVYYIGLVLRPGDEYPQLIKLFEVQQLADLLDAYQSGEQTTLGSLYKTETLYNLIWKPLEPLLKNTTKIWYSPDGQLNRIAFSSMPMPDGKRLNEKYSLSCLGSTRQLAFAAPVILQTERTAAIFGGIGYDADTTEMERTVALEDDGNYGRFRGNPNDPGQAWEYLPNAEQEAAEVSRLLQLGGYRTKLFSGVEASEAAIKRLCMESTSPTILHIATHGYFFSKPLSQDMTTGNASEPVFKVSVHPLVRSGLIFAGANHAWMGKPPKGKEDGILTAYEISQLNLSCTEVAVLSACDSGLGDIEGSEGVYGLQRAFKLAGVKYVVMSLWQVPDYATKELMTLFYTNLLRYKLPVSEALQTAQREMEKKYENPFMWAGFVVVE